MEVECPLEEEVDDHVMENENEIICKENEEYAETMKENIDGGCATIFTNNLLVDVRHEEYEKFVLKLGPYSMMALTI